MTKHTRGPFLASPRPDIDVGIPYYEIIVDPNQSPRRGFIRVAQVCGDQFRSRKETRANAELFAAAPELLEALEEMVDLQQYRTPDDPQCIDEAWRSENDAIARAKKAIFKAKGTL